LPHGDVHADSDSHIHPDTYSHGDIYTYNNPHGNVHANSNSNTYRNDPSAATHSDSKAVSNANASPEYNLDILDAPVQLGQSTKRRSRCSGFENCHL
jgi:hypothetical protein